MDEGRTEEDLQESIGVDGRTILEGILKKIGANTRTGLIQLRIGIIGESL